MLKRELMEENELLKSKADMYKREEMLARSKVHALEKENDKQQKEIDRLKTIVDMVSTSAQSVIETKFPRHYGTDEERDVDMTQNPPSEFENFTRFIQGKCWGAAYDGNDFRNHFS